MTLRALLIASLLLAPLCGPAALAQTATEAGEGETGDAAEELRALSKTMMIPELFALLKAEGVSRGEDMEADMFPGRGGERWKAAVAAIYDIPRLQGEFEEIMARELSGDAAAIAEMQAFFGSEPGQRILKLEIDARYALLDEATEEAARVAWDKAVGARDPRVKLIRKLAEANELIEMNVAGAMTGNLAFFQGMNESGTLGPAMNEQDIMADVWGQEEQIRRDTEAWLYPFLLLAYTPLSDSEMEAYVAFSETAAGQRLNAALFAGFDVVFRGISHDLGRAAGLALQGSDI